MAELDHRLTPSLANADLEASAASNDQSIGPEVVPVAEDAVLLFRSLNEDRTVIDQRNLVRALRNLGECYQRVGRVVDAVSAIQEAIDILLTFAADNPSDLEDLAHAILLLADKYGHMVQERALL
ncbi:hypothetical protein ACW9HQ_51405, partial [Nocardia gipuzkoensis]